MKEFFKVQSNARHPSRYQHTCGHVLLLVIAGCLFGGWILILLGVIYIAYKFIVMLDQIGVLKLIKELFK